MSTVNNPVKMSYYMKKKLKKLENKQDPAAEEAPIESTDNGSTTENAAEAGLPATEPEQKNQQQKKTDGVKRVDKGRLRRERIRRLTRTLCNKAEILGDPSDPDQDVCLMIMSRRRPHRAVVHGTGGFYRVFNRFLQFHNSGKVYEPFALESQADGEAGEALNESEMPAADQDVVQYLEHIDEATANAHAKQQQASDKRAVLQLKGDQPLPSEITSYLQSQGIIYSCDNQ